jgi:hypothetical protein
MSTTPPRVVAVDLLVEPPALIWSDGDVASSPRSIAREIAVQIVRQNDR